jgi:hypothetical protein|tara:strand:- start:7233 stop:7508 length:276 start_codon:yes stop_codon:yes gene_type:complete
MKERTYHTHRIIKMVGRDACDALKAFYDVRTYRAAFMQFEDDDPEGKKKAGVLIKLASNIDIDALERAVKSNSHAWMADIMRQRNEALSKR